MATDCTVTVTLEPYYGQQMLCVEQTQDGDFAISKYGERCPLKYGDCIAHIGKFAIDVYREINDEMVSTLPEAE